MRPQPDPPPNERLHISYTLKKLYFNYVEQYIIKITSKTKKENAQKEKKKKKIQSKDQKTASSWVFYYNK